MDFLPRLLIVWILCSLAAAILWAVRRWDDPPPPPPAKRTPPPVPVMSPLTVRVGWTQVELEGVPLYSTTVADSGELRPARAA